MTILEPWDDYGTVGVLEAPRIPEAACESWCHVWIGRGDRCVCGDEVSPAAGLLAELAAPR